jgi:hypothetical protein
VGASFAVGPASEGALGVVVDGDVGAAPAGPLVSAVALATNSGPVLLGLAAVGGDAGDDKIGEPDAVVGAGAGCGCGCDDDRTAAGEPLDVTVDAVATVVDGVALGAMTKAVSVGAVVMPGATLIVPGGAGAGAGTCGWAAAAVGGCAGAGVPGAAVPVRGGGGVIDKITAWIWVPTTCTSSMTALPTGGGAGVRKLKIPASVRSRVWPRASRPTTMPDSNAPATS